MLSIDLFEDGKHVRVYIETSRYVMEVPKDQLKEGAVFGIPNNETEVIRLWVENGRIMVLHLFSHDIRWPHHVFEFPLVFTKNASPTRVRSLAGYLGGGRGIPALTTNE